MSDSTTGESSKKKMLADLKDKLSNPNHKTTPSNEILTPVEIQPAEPPAPVDVPVPVKNDTLEANPPSPVSEAVKPAEEPTKGKGRKPREAKEAKGPTEAKEPLGQQGTTTRFTSLQSLQQALKSVKAFFTFGKRYVYVDDDIAEVLDLLKKKGKINSNLLTSYLLQRFIIDHKDLIQELRENRENKFFK